LYFELSGTKHDYNVKLNLTDTTATGLSNFQITGIQSDLLDMSANISVYVPAITISGNYKLRGMARLFVPIPLLGNGVFTLQPVGATCDIFGKIGFSEEGELILKELDFSLRMKDLKVLFTGIMGAGVSRRINNIMNAMGLKMFNKMEPKFHEKVRTRGIVEVNKVFKDWEYNYELWKEMLEQQLKCFFG